MGIFDGSSSSGGGIFGSSAPSAGIVLATPPSSTKRHGIGGFFDNLGGDVHDLSGVYGGLKNMGSAIAHDTKEIFGNASGPSQLSPIAKSIYHSYVDKGTAWGEAERELGSLIHGDMAGFRKHRDASNALVYAHPVGPLLDASSVVTGGSSILGKTAARIAAETGSETAARIAGLTRVAEITPSTVRGITGRAGSFAAATHKIVDPLTNQTLHELPVAANPVIRLRQLAKEAAYTKLPATSYLSPTRRGARLTEQAAGRAARREAGNVDRAYRTAVAKLSPDETNALFYISQGFDTAERAKQLIVARAERVQAKTAEHDALASSTRKGAKAKLARVAADTQGLLNDAKVIEQVLPHIEQPSSKLVAAVKAQRVADTATQNAFVRSLIRGGLSPEEAKARIIARAQMPLRKVSITPRDGEVPMIITHVLKGNKDGHGIEQSFERGLNTKRALAEERKTSGANWIDAKYERNPASVLSSHRLMFAKEQTHARMARALANAVPYDPTKHGAMVRTGTAVLLKKNDRLVRDMHYVDQSLNRIERSLPDATDPEIEHLRDTYGAMYDLIHEHGSPGVVLPKPHYDELVKQFDGAKGILEKLTDGVGNLTKPWRHIVLSLKGSFYVNNFLSNMFLGLVAYGPRYIADVAHESLPAGLRDAKSTRITSEVTDMTRAAGARNVATSRAAKFDVISRLGDATASKLAPLTEDNFRRGAFRANLRDSVKQLRDAHPHMSRSDAVEAIFNDKTAVDQLAEKTYGDLLDYSKLTPVERELLLPILPFWNFTRAMTGRTIQLTLDEPWKMRVLLYAGHNGVVANQNALPTGIHLPSYLSGLVLLDKTGELQRVLSTAGSNPLTAPMDLFSELVSVKGGGNDSPNILSSINPYFKAPLEALVGKDMFTGQDIVDAKGHTPTGLAGKMLVQGEKNIPQLAMYQRYRYPSKYPAVQRDLSDTIAQYLGAPIGTLNPNNIAAVNAIQAQYAAQQAAAEDARKTSIAERARF